jgi:hypothetical protein
MSLDPDRALQAAVLAALRADAGVTALVAARIYDEPPAQPIYPYVTIGRAETRPLGGVDGEGVEHALSLTCVSRFGGAEEATAVVGAMRAALHGAELTLTDHRLVNLRATFSDTFRATDWRSTYGVLRMRAVTEPS